jgi:hypothetical protein
MHTHTQTRELPNLKPLVNSPASPAVLPPPPAVLPQLPSPQPGAHDESHYRLPPALLSCPLTEERGGSTLHCYLCVSVEVETCKVLA